MTYLEINDPPLPINTLYKIALKNNHINFMLNLGAGLYWRAWAEDHINLKPLVQTMKVG
jgi:hypothetical protein